MDIFLEQAKGIDVFEPDGFKVEEVEAEKDNILFKLYDGLDDRTPGLRIVAVKELFLMQAGLATASRFGRRL